MARWAVTSSGFGGGEGVGPHLAPPREKIVYPKHGVEGVLAVVTGNYLKKGDDNMEYVTSRHSHDEGAKVHCVAVDVRYDGDFVEYMDAVRAVDHLLSSLRFDDSRKNPKAQVIRMYLAWLDQQP